MALDCLASAESKTDATAILRATLATQLAGLDVLREIEECEKSVRVLLPQQDTQKLRAAITRFEKLTALVVEQLLPGNRGFGGGSTGCSEDR